MQMQSMRIISSFYRLGVCATIQQHRHLRVGVLVPGCGGPSRAAAGSSRPKEGLCYVTGADAGAP